jgi:hypothetical protein
MGNNPLTRVKAGQVPALGGRGYWWSRPTGPAINSAVSPDRDMESITVVGWAAGPYI